MRATSAPGAVGAAAEDEARCEAVVSVADVAVMLVAWDGAELAEAGKAAAGCTGGVLGALPLPLVMPAAARPTVVAPAAGTATAVLVVVAVVALVIAPVGVVLGPAGSGC